MASTVCSAMLLSLSTGNEFSCVIFSSSRLLTIFWFFSPCLARHYFGLIQFGWPPWPRVSSGSSSSSSNGDSESRKKHSRKQIEYATREKYTHTHTYQTVTEKLVKNCWRFLYIGKRASEWAVAWTHFTCSFSSRIQWKESKQNGQSMFVLNTRVK